MKISAKQYARSLAEAAAGQNEAEQKIIVGRFLSLLKEQGKFNLAPQIAAELEKLVLAEQGIIKAEVQSANKLSEAALKDLSKLIKDKTGCQEVRLEAKVDADLLGGATLKYQDKIVNFSLKYFLSKMKQTLIK